MTTGRCAAATLVVLGLALASTAAAGPPGTWSRAGKIPGSSAFQAGLARTADGVLHVASLRRDGAKADLWQTLVGPDGRVLGSSPIVRGWSSLSSPDLVLQPDGGLRVLFGGSHTAEPTETNSGLNTATAPAAGAPWTLQEGRAAQAPEASTADVGAAVAKDGTPIVAWAAPTGLRYRYGVDPATQDVDVPLPGCCAFDPAVAVDGVGGQAYLAWASDARSGAGVVVQAIAPGGPSGPRLYARRSATRTRRSAVVPEQRVALAARSGSGGVYLAYGTGFPTFKTVSLWRIGGGVPTIRIPAPGAAAIALAPAPEGRLWLAWERGGRLYVTRTNRAATRVEPVRALAPPPRTTSIWKVQGDASAGPLDLVVNVDARAGTTFWHQQVLPQLSVAVTASPQANEATRYTFRITDAGDPVANATVRAGAQTLTTGLPGTVVLTTTDHPPAAIGSKAGYVSATVTIP